MVINHLLIGMILQVGQSPTVSWLPNLLFETGSTFSHLCQGLNGSCTCFGIRTTSKSTHLTTGARQIFCWGCPLATRGGDFCSTTRSIKHTTPGQVRPFLCRMKVFNRLPSRELTYPDLVKRKIIFKSALGM